MFSSSCLLPSPSSSCYPSSSCLLTSPSSSYSSHGSHFLPLPLSLHSSSSHILPLPFASCYFLGLRFDTMEVIPKKLFYQSKISLEVDCYNSTSIFDIVNTSTIMIMNSTTTNVSQQWALLAKQLDSWKLMNHIATT